MEPMLILIEGLLHSTFNGSNNEFWLLGMYMKIHHHRPVMLLLNHENTSNRYIHKLDGPFGLFKGYYSSSVSLDLINIWNIIGLTIRTRESRKR